MVLSLHWPLGRDTSQAGRHHVGRLPQHYFVGAHGPRKVMRGPFESGSSGLGCHLGFCFGVYWLQGLEGPSRSNVLQPDSSESSDTLSMPSTGVAGNFIVVGTGSLSMSRLSASVAFRVTSSSG